MNKGSDFEVLKKASWVALAMTAFLYVVSIRLDRYIFKPFKRRTFYTQPFIPSSEENRHSHHIKSSYAFFLYTPYGDKGYYESYGQVTMKSAPDIDPPYLPKQITPPPNWELFYGGARSRSFPIFTGCFTGCLN